MKKLLFVLFSSLLVLVACDAEEPKEKAGDKASENTNKEETINETPTEETPDEEVIDEEVIDEEETADEEEAVDSGQEESTQSMSEEELKEIINYNGTGEGDTLVSASLKDGEIKAVIELAQDDLLSSDTLAVTRYSQVSDELLAHEGWDDLTIEYVGIGTISMNRSEKEANEYNMDYFPVDEIEERLK